MGVFLMQDLPQYAPFIVESNAIKQKSKMGGGSITFITLPNNTNSAHSSSIVDVGEKLMVVYFAGSREGASDVAIMQHFINKDSLEYSAQRTILDAKMLSFMTYKFIKKLGNPVVFRDKNGVIHLFVVGVSLGGWATSKIYQLKFSNDLKSLEFIGELKLGLLANFSHLVRTPPIMLENGGFMLPYYHELAHKYALVGFFDSNANYTHSIKINRLKGQLQPTIIALNKYECLAFFRNHKAYNNASFLQKCEHFGKMWDLPQSTNLKGYDDSPLLISYKNTQGMPRILLIYNDGRRQKNGTFADSGSTRASISLYMLQNAENKALESQEILDFGGVKFRAYFDFLHNIDNIKELGEVSYPSATISDGWLFIAYTHNRKNIIVKRISLEYLEAKC